jgi:hypothetical protein
LTFTEIQTAIKDRLNYNNTATDTRLGNSINRIYKQVTSSIGVRRARYNNTSMAVTADNPEVVFSGVEKLLTVWRQSDSGSPTILREVPMERLREALASDSDKPNYYAIKKQTSNTVTIRLDHTPDTAYTLYADVIAEVSDLSGSNEPAFPESFHDILVEGVLMEEYRKLEKVALARDSERTYKERLSDLRMFLATSASMDMYQGIYTMDSLGGAVGGGSSATQSELNGLYAAEIVLLAQVVS